MEGDQCKLHHLMIMEVDKVAGEVADMEVDKVADMVVKELMKGLPMIF